MNVKHVRELKIHHDKTSCKSPDTDYYLLDISLGDLYMTARFYELQLKSENHYVMCKHSIDVSRVKLGNDAYDKHAPILFDMIKSSKPLKEVTDYIQFLNL